MKEIQLKNGQTLIIEPARLEHAEQFANYANKIKTETNFISMDIRDGLSTIEGQEKYIRTTDAPGKYIFIASINGRMVGCGNLSPVSTKSRFAHRSDMGISVLKEFWGLGIASEIMKLLIETAEFYGYEQIELAVVDGNEPAKHLYEKFGFYETGYRNNAMKYADGSYAKFILMQKDLIKKELIQN